MFFRYYGRLHRRYHICGSNTFPCLGKARRLFLSMSLGPQKGPKKIRSGNHNLTPTEEACIEGKDAGAGENECAATTDAKPAVVLAANAHCSPMHLLGGEVERVEANAICSLDGAAADTELRGNFAI